MTVIIMRLMILCLLLHKPWLIYTASLTIVHVYPTGCLPVLLILQVSFLLCSDRELDSLVAERTS